MCIFEGDPEQPTTANKAKGTTIKVKGFVMVDFDMVEITNLIKCAYFNHTMCSCCAGHVQS